MEGVIKTKWGYKVNGFQVVRRDSLWNHTLDRVRSFKAKCKTDEEFEKKMVTRLRRIKNMEKIYFTIAVLIDEGYPEIAEIYDSRLVMEDLTKDLDFLDEL